MKGKLTDQPLAELIREILSKGLSGTLRLEHELARAAVYFLDGQVVFAASNIRTLRLREYLTKRGLVSETELANLGNNLSDLGLAAALRSNGSLRQEDINTVLATLVKDTLRVALLWTEGSWDFNERARLDDPVRVKLDTNTLLREAAQRLPLKFVSLRFRNPSETVSRPAGIPGIDNLLPAESFMLSRLDAPTNVEQLIAASAIERLDAYRTLYGLTLSGLVQREYWQNAFRTEPTAPSKTQTPTKVPPVASQSTSESTDSRWGSANEMKEVQPFLDRLSLATNHYEVIDLPPTAGATEVKDAYYALARRFHPDRFHLESGTRLHTQVSSAFARITQAYETLMDPKARAAYDLSLQRSAKFADSAPKSSNDDSVPGATEKIDFEIGSAGGQAEQSFQEGFGALKQGRFNAALPLLAMASRLAPNEPRYRAYYGRALSANENTRRQAEGELQAAVTLDPASAVYRTMLAELYFDLNFHRRAKAELDRALALDPNHPGAHSLLQKLESSGKAP
jgi:tetratricopeptide (TPR) repeat protein